VGVAAVLTTGIFVGAIYALFAVGLVVIYKGSRVINFAHGEVGMVGTYVFTSMHTDRGVSLVLSILAGVLTSAAIGVAIERVIARPLGAQSANTAMIGTFAVSGILLALAVSLWSPYPRPQPPFFAGSPLHFASVYVSRQQLFAGACAVALMLVLSFFYSRTWLGFTMRAAAMSPGGAQVVGINVNRLSMVTWGLGSALAGLAGILVSPLVTFDVFFMTALLVRGLSAALLGGLVSIPLTLAAAIGIAELEAVLQYETTTAGITEAVLTVAIVAMLVLRPRGLRPAGVGT
jgi:branched-subunit amino acid ABC-type transport system permease component